MPAEKRRAATTAVESLLDNFEEVDATFHGLDGKSYGDVQTSITEALTTLGEIAGE